MRVDIDESRCNNESFSIDRLLGINDEVLAYLSDAISVYNNNPKEPGVATAVYDLSVFYM